MSKFKIVNRIIDGKNVEVEIGNNTRRISTKFIASEAITEKQHYQ